MPQKNVGFEPVYNNQSKLLILGSFPSPRSFEEDFYYGHPQNRFWPLLAALLKEPLPQTKEQKTALLLNHRIALWDTLQSCTRQGASDATIRHAVPNDIARLVKQSAVDTILCNGAASYTYYKRYAEKNTAIEAVKLPSTSPANAQYSFEKLANLWGRYLPF